MHTLVAYLLHDLSWGLNGWTLLILAAEVAATFTIPSILLQRRGQPLSALSWTLALIGLPFIGVLGWWAFGRTHLERKRRKRRTARLIIGGELADVRPPAEWDEELLPAGRLSAENAAGIFPAVGGNRVRLLVDGPCTYQALEEMAGSARSHLHFLFYVWEPDGTGRRFRDLLADKARHGVQVRVLLDAMGSRRAAGRFMDPLRKAGAQVALFEPARWVRRSLSINFRNHRKIVVADGRAGYNGGLNIGDEYLHEWRDMGLLLEGPAVAQLQEVFLDDWFFATGEECAEPGYFEEAVPQTGDELASCGILAGGPDTIDNPTLDAFFLGLTRARERVWITTPYLAPGVDILTALRTAVYRGVDVRLLVPRRSDNPLARLVGRSYYPTLLRAGIRVFEYLSAVLHAKTWIFDAQRVAVGSVNMDNRSFKLNFECTCFLRSGKLNERMAALFEGDLAHSEEMTMEKVERAGRWQELKEAAANLLSPLM